MSKASLLLLLCCLHCMLPPSLTEGSSKFSVIQPPTSSTVILGGTGKLGCTFAPGSSVKRAVSWLKSPTGGNFSVSKQVNMNHRISLAFPDSFLQRADASLIITNASLEDAGVYYCKIMLWNKGEAHGRGTPLLVYVPPTQPTISLLQATKSNDKHSLVCKTDGFYPPPVRITWRVIGLPVADSTPAPLECQNKEGIGQMTSTLTLPHLPPSGGSATVLCSVTHPSLSQPLTTNYTFPASEKHRSVSLIQCLNILKIGLVIALTLHFLVFGACRAKRNQKVSKEEPEETCPGWSSRTLDKYPKHTVKDAVFKQQGLGRPRKSV